MAEVLIMGLGDTGASIGLALARAGDNLKRTGYDPNVETARAAQKAGAVDRLTSNPRHTAGQADLILYTLGGGSLGPGLETIAEDVKSDALLIDTTPLKQGILEAIPSHLKSGAAFVGAVPILGPDRVFQVDPIAPGADLFDGGLLALVLPSGTPPSAVDVCMDLAALLGAMPFFLEAAELDAAVAAGETMPIVLAAAYLRSLAGPGWRDQGLLAARAFDSLTRLASAHPPADTAESLAANRSHMIRWIDALLAELEDLRGMIARADAQDLGRRFEQAASAYQAWRAQRRRGPAEAAAPPIDETPRRGLARLLGQRQPRSPSR